MESYLPLLTGLLLGICVALFGVIYHLRKKTFAAPHDKEDETLLLGLKDIAQEVLEARTESLAKTNEKNIGNILKPLEKDIADFKKQLADNRDATAEKHGDLGRQIKELKELNLQISDEARGLTLALKGENKTQGNWGEMVLERVLEMSGLEEGREYKREVTETDESGKRKRPDVVVLLPENRQVVIDSKVSIKAYEGYCAAEDEEERTQALKAHIASIKSHVSNLSSKRYQHLEALNTLDFVLMFMPIEAAFTEALRADREIFNDAIAKNIVIVTPTTLLATLRTIDTMWNSERQAKHAQEIARLGGALHDKFVNFVADLESIGNRIRQADDDYEKAMNKLSTGKGSLIARVQKLDSLGAKTSKKLPEHLTENEPAKRDPQSPPAIAQEKEKEIDS